jgi:two-component system sensor histidine kinase QseC
MSLRLRLLLIIGLSFLLLWLAASTWMLRDLRNEVRATLDERLAASAHMVAGLLAQLPPAPVADMSPARPMQSIGAIDGVACEVRQFRGNIVARTGNSPERLGVALPGYRTRTIDGERWRTFTLERNGLRVTTADRVERREQLLYGVVRAASVPVLIAMGGSLLALGLGVRTGLAPLERIRAALAARDPGALQPLSKFRVPFELSALVTTVNALLARVANALERERRFTGDAAHELRTPLTAVKTHIQVARLCTDAEATGQALAQAEAGVNRLQRTIEQLLILARLDGPLPFDDHDRGSANDIARSAIAQVAPASQSRVVIEQQGIDGALAMPSGLAVTALRNLLDNALRYSPPGSQVLLRIEPADGHILFRVEDGGSGMSDEDIVRATERFWRKGRGHGCGLGLSIVETVVQRYGGELALANRAGGGLSAYLHLPSTAG